MRFTNFLPCRQLLHFIVPRRPVRLLTPTEETALEFSALGRGSLISSIPLTINQKKEKT